MTPQQFDLKVKRAKDKYRIKIKKQLAIARRHATMAKGEDKNWRTNNVLTLERALAKGSPFRLTLRKYDRYFKNSSDTCGLDLINERGHSYHWWDMFAKIKGRYVLNTYRYSNQTAKHIGKASSTLAVLNIPYIDIEAPRGLQSLDLARDYAIIELSNEIVRLKYARFKNNWYLLNCKKRIKNLAKIGIKITDSDIQNDLISAESRRRMKLDSAKERKERRLQWKLEAEQRRLVQEKQHLSVIQGGVA